jgi:hypothetical protein
MAINNNIYCYILREFQHATHSVLMYKKILSLEITHVIRSYMILKYITYTEKEKEKKIRN